MSDDQRPASLPGLLLRDAALLGVLIAGVLVLSALLHSFPETLLSGTTITFAAITAYVAGHLAREWGLLVGSYASGLKLTLKPYASAQLADWTSLRPSRRQLLSLAWASIVTYTALTLVLARLCWRWDLGSAGNGLLLGMLAFTSASLAIDLPATISVHRGASPTRNLPARRKPSLVFRRTLLAWALLAFGALWWASG